MLTINDVSNISMTYLQLCMLYGPGDSNTWDKKHRCRKQIHREPTLGTGRGEARMEYSRNNGEFVESHSIRTVAMTASPAYPGLSLSRHAMSACQSSGMPRLPKFSARADSEIDRALL